MDVQWTCDVDSADGAEGQCWGADNAVCWYRLRFLLLAIFCIYVSTSIPFSIYTSVVIQNEQFISSNMAEMVGDYAVVPVNVCWYCILKNIMITQLN